MITSSTNYLDAKYKTFPNDSYNGVVRVSYGGSYGTGTLLYDGRSILTVAHLFTENTTSSHEVKVYVDTPSGKKEYTATYTTYPSYDSVTTNGDVAIVHLLEPVSSDANRYELYRTTDEVGKNFTMLGYGSVGYGSIGVDDSYNGNIIKLQTQNKFDVDVASLKENSIANINWLPPVNSQLFADFDDTTHAHDAFGRLAGKVDLGLGEIEGIIAPGDSGGPAFINNKVAGVATYTANLSTNSIKPDINSVLDSSFGEIAAWQRVSYFQEWIDQTLRSNYKDAPVSKEDVVTSIDEGVDATITTVYFLLQFTEDRSETSENISVDYTTRNGTAIAGEDYIAVSGSVVLYANESQTVIPVEIIGDNICEEDEYFYLDISNPSYGSFGNDIETLSAMRTIVNDDFIC